MTTTQSRPVAHTSRAALPLPGDVLLAAVVLLTTLPRYVHQPFPVPHQVLIFSFALAIPLLWRRRRPELVFGALCVVGFIQWVTTTPVPADVALLIAFYTVAATAPMRRVAVAAVALEGGVLLAVLRYTDDGQRSHLLGVIFLSALVVAAGVIGANVRVRRAYLAEVEQRAARLEFERDQQGQLAVAAERGRIAREMHDIIAHNLSVMIALADGAALTSEGDPARARSAMVEAAAAGRRALGEMRRVLGVLRDASDAAELSPTPGLGDIDRLLVTIRRTGLRASFTCEGPTATIPAGVQLSIYRLIQESLTNTVKHAVGADRVSVTLRTSSDWIDVIVTDNGAASGATGAEDGHGITGMRERIFVHAGHVDVGPTASGWRVQARIPAHHEAFAVAG
jgi:signal transduction histidine kinase